MSLLQIVWDSSSYDQTMYLSYGFLDSSSYDQTMYLSKLTEWTACVRFARNIIWRIMYFKAIKGKVSDGSPFLRLVPPFSNIPPL